MGCTGAKRFWSDVGHDIMLRSYYRVYCTNADALTLGPVKLVIVTNFAGGFQSKRGLESLTLATTRSGCHIRAKMLSRLMKRSSVRVSRRKEDNSCQGCLCNTNSRIMIA